MSELPPAAAPLARARPAWLAGVAGLGFALLCGVWVFPQGVRDTPYHGDESGWISAANYHTELLLDLDFEHGKWSETPVGAFGSLNQQLGKFILGLGLRLHPAREPGDSEFLRLYDFGRSLLWNRDHGRLAPQGILRRARSVMATGAYLCVGLIFVAGWRYGNFWCGVALVPLLLACQWVVVPYSRAMTDSYYNAFMVGALCAALPVLRANDTRSLCWTGVGMGLLAGLGCSMKVTALAVVSIFFALVLLYRLALRGFRFRENLLAVLSFSVVALAVVYWLNPFLWPTSSWENLLELPRFYPRFAELYSRIVPDSWEGRSRFWSIQQVLFSSEFHVLPLESLLFLTGLGFGGLSLLRSLRGGAPDPRVIPMLYFLVHYGFLVAFLQKDWTRYYLPTVFAMKLVTVLGGLELVRWALARTSPGTPAPRGPASLELPYGSEPGIADASKAE